MHHSIAFVRSGLPHQLLANSLYFLSFGSLCFSFFYSLTPSFHLFYCFSPFLMRPFGLPFIPRIPCHLLLTFEYRGIFHFCANLFISLLPPSIASQTKFLLFTPSSSQPIINYGRRAGRSRGRGRQHPQKYLICLIGSPIRRETNKVPENAVPTIYSAAFVFSFFLPEGTRKEVQRHFCE